MCRCLKYFLCIVLLLAADGATTPGNSGGQKEAGVRFKADCNLGKFSRVDRIGVKNFSTNSEVSMLA